MELTAKQSRRLIYSTWLQVLLSGAIVVICTSTNFWYGLVLSLAIGLFSLINFWTKSEDIPIKIWSDLPEIFLPTAFFSVISAVIVDMNTDELSPWTLGLSYVGFLCFLLLKPESRYLNHSWNKKSATLLCGRFF